MNASGAKGFARGIPPKNFFEKSFFGIFKNFYKINRSEQRITMIHLSERLRYIRPARICRAFKSSWRFGTFLGEGSEKSRGRQGFAVLIKIFGVKPLFQKGLAEFEAEPQCKPIAGQNPCLTEAF